MFTGTVRRDGYCAFGANNPWATFPSLSVAWSFANEKFFKWEPMSTGKLRVSWGKNGNRQLADPYLALAIWLRVPEVQWVTIPVRIMLI